MYFLNSLFTTKICSHATFHRMKEINKNVHTKLFIWNKKTFQWLRHHLQMFHELILYTTDLTRVTVGKHENEFICSKLIICCRHFCVLFHLLFEDRKCCSFQIGLNVNLFDRYLFVPFGYLFGRQQTLFLKPFLKLLLL